MFQKMAEFINACGCKVRTFKLTGSEALALAWELSALTGFRASPAETFRRIELGEAYIMGSRLVLRAS